MLNVIGGTRLTSKVKAEVTSPVYPDPRASLSGWLITHSHLIEIHHYHSSPSAAMSSHYLMGPMLLYGYIQCLASWLLGHCHTSLIHLHLHDQAEICGEEADFEKKLSEI